MNQNINSITPYQKDTNTMKIKLKEKRSNNTNILDNNYYNI